MLNRTFKLSSNWQFFHQECKRLKMIFARLHYPETLVENTIRHFIEMKVAENVCVQVKFRTEKYLAMKNKAELYFQARWQPYVQFILET